MTEEEKKAKKREYSRKYYQENKDRIIARSAEYYAANKEDIAAKRAAYYAANKEEIAAKGAAYYAANKEKKAAYYQENKEKVDARHAKYCAEHKDEIAAYRAAYYKTKRGRAIMLAASYIQYDKNRGFDSSNTVTAEWIVANVFSGQKCIYCGDSDWAHLGVDRLDNDKPHTPENVVCACGICNMEKNDRYTVEDFVEYRKLNPRTLDTGIEKSWEITELPSGTKVIKKKPIPASA